jgi:hypothetical protein
MDAAVIVALIALVGAVGNVGLTYFLNARSEQRRALKREDATWARYRASLAIAAEELADRIDNILNRDFLGPRAFGRSPYRDEAILSTLFRLCQYFGWSEILRREMRVANPRYATEAQVLAERWVQVGRTFSTDRYGSDPFMVWRESQRALGELMITREGEAIDIVGVAGFLADFDKFRPWLSRLERHMKNEQPGDWPAGERERLDDIHSALETLVAALR